MKKLNYAGPSITDLEIKYVNDAVKNGFYENYKHHTSVLEKNICKILNIKYALALNTCTSALHLSLLALNIGKGDEVITSDSTCVASALPILYVNAKPIFVSVVRNEKTVPEIFSPTSKLNLSEISAVMALINGSGPEKENPYKTINVPTPINF